jgi:3',5'-cyclic AMP phosphodiesterase CpdA
MRRLGFTLIVLAVAGGLYWLAVGVQAQDPGREMPRATVPAPPADGERGEVVFCVFGDCRPDGNPGRLQITSRLAAGMAEERPQVVLGTGDYIDGNGGAAGNPRQLAAFFETLAPLQKYGEVPLAAALGNHDIPLGTETLRQSFGPAYYSFNIGTVHFVVLDTEQPGEIGRIDGRQWQWLVQDLEQAQGATLTFVALHRPLFPVDGHRGESLDKYPRFRDQLHRLFVQRKVTCVFQGHEHLYNRQERDGVVYVITGGGGAPLYASEMQGGFHHYLRVDAKDGRYSVVVKRLD